MIVRPEKWRFRMCPKINISQRGQSMVFVQKLNFFLCLFFAVITSKKIMFFYYREKKKRFFDQKSELLESAPKSIFSTGLVYG